VQCCIFPIQTDKVQKLGSARGPRERPTVRMALHAAERIVDVSD
jgi:hypothetical protein